MKIVILAGGLGTRLRPFTFTIPKPLLPIGNKALLDYSIEHVSHFNFDEIIISLGYQAELVKAYCSKYFSNSIPISFVEELSPLGTAGSLSLIKIDNKYNEPIFLMNGDVLTKVNFDKMKKYHQANSASITVGYIVHKYKSPFGVLDIQNNQITNIIEKPEYSWPVSSGIYSINLNILKDIPINKYYTMPELILDVKNKGGKIMVYEIEEYWRALETPDHFEMVSKEILNY